MQRSLEVGGSPTSVSAVTRNTTYNCKETIKSLLDKTCKALGLDLMIASWKIASHSSHFVGRVDGPQKSLLTYGAKRREKRTDIMNFPL